MIVLQTSMIFKIILSIVLGYLVCYLVRMWVGILERGEFNDGKCTCCGSPLRWFDVDSRGGRGYCCDQCMHVVWVSHKSVDKEYLTNLDDDTASNMGGEKE